MDDRPRRSSSKVPQWNKEQIDAAIQAMVTQQKTLTEAALEFNVPYATLYTKVVGDIKTRRASLKAAKLTPLEEQAVLKFCLSLRSSNTLLDKAFKKQKMSTTKKLDEIIEFIKKIK